MHRCMDPSFFVTETTGDAQLLLEVSMTPRSRKLTSSSFKAFLFASGNHLGPNLTHSPDVIFILCWSISVIDKSFFDFANPLTNSVWSVNHGTSCEGALPHIDNTWTHEWSRRKSTPITIEASISATTIPCDKITVPVPSCKSSCTVPTVSTMLPSANRILTGWLSSLMFTLCGSLKSTDGWTMLIVDPVSINPITLTPHNNTGGYKLPVPSTSGSSSSIVGPYEL